MWLLVVVVVSVVAVAATALRNYTHHVHRSACFANVCGALGENDKTKGTHKETTQQRVSRNNTTSYFSSSALFKRGYYLTTYTLSSGWLLPETRKHYAQPACALT